MPASDQSTVVATFENSGDAQSASSELRLNGFTQDRVHTRGGLQPALIVEAGERYHEAEHILRHYSLRALRIRLRRSPLAAELGCVLLEHVAGEINGGLQPV